MASLFECLVIWMNNLEPCEIKRTREVLLYCMVFFGCTIMEYSGWKLRNVWAMSVGKYSQEFFKINNAVLCVCIVFCRVLEGSRRLYNIHFSFMCMYAKVSCIFMREKRYLYLWRYVISVCLSFIAHIWTKLQEIV